MLADKLLKPPQTTPTYIEDIFSTYLYTGTGATLSIVNNIDLATKGGLTWIKQRGQASAHALFDTARGATNRLATNGTNAQATVSGVTAFNTNGFTSGADAETNGSGNTYASWTFRKQPKFFDVVTYTGNGTSQNIAHSLGSVPGCIMVKATSGISNWFVYHRSLGNANLVYLNATSASAATTIWNNTDPTSTQFSINGTSGNASGVTYVAYLFAHDAGGFGLTGTDNVISCGSFTATPADNALVNLGYEPQYVLVKKTSGVENWLQFDSMRGMTMGDDSLLNPNLSGAENNSAGNNYLNPDPQGFRTIGFSGTYIYIAIRRGPMKVPTDGTKVFAPVTQSAGGTVTTNFPVDMTIVRERAGVNDNYLIDRLRGDSTTSYNYLLTNTTAAASSGTGAGLGLDSNTGFKDSLFGGTGYIYWNFQRAPSFFDEVCYTGNGSTQNISHNLAAVPELMFIKRRDVSAYWPVYSAALGNSAILQLETTGAVQTGAPQWNSTTPTSSVFSLGTSSGANTSGGTYVAYIFATCAGVSKVGSYTGNGSTQTINCGFAGGARFVLIKRTDSTGGWYVYDTARGMTTLTDPYLFLNSTAAEAATLGSVTTVTTGFAVNASILAAINTNAASYIYLAIA